MKKKKTAVLLAILCILSIFTACKQDPPEPIPAPSVSEDGYSMAELNEEMFKDNALTMVNVFATWCSPCMWEMPHLEEIDNKYADRGVRVIGIVLDAVMPDGSINSETLNNVEYIREEMNLDFQMCLPNYDMFDGKLKSVQSVPETFFVDREGDIVGESYVGARDVEGWESVLENDFHDVIGQ